jgi:hypothetical protein
VFSGDANSASLIQEVMVPNGTMLERSRAIPMPDWGRMPGGAEQFKLLERILDANFGPGDRQRNRGHCFEQFRHRSLWQRRQRSDQQPPYRRILVFQLGKVGWLRPCLRQTTATFIPISVFFSIATIFLSVNRLFLMLVLAVAAKSSVFDLSHFKRSLHVASNLCQFTQIVN